MEQHSHLQSIGFIGAGRVGTTLALALTNAGYPVTAVHSRSADSTHRFTEHIPSAKPYTDPQSVADGASIIFITTPDDAIADVAQSVRWQPGQTVVHCSGVLSADIMGSAKLAGASVAGFHPLQSFPTIESGADRLSGCTIALEGDDAVVEQLKALAVAIGGNPLRLQADQKALYHLAATFASNYMVTITDIAAELWSTFGVDKRTAVAAITPLMQGTLDNIATIGLPDCLTGPIARGDTGTIRLHLNTLAVEAPHLLPAYRTLGLRTLPIAEAKGGLNEMQWSEMVALLAG